MPQATKFAILNANYVAERLHEHYPVVYRGKQGRVAHECIIDLRPLKKSAGIEAEDVAKRLMDYGFHAPTMSFPIPGHPDDRADGERIARRAGPLLRRHDRHPPGDSRDRDRRCSRARTTCSRTRPTPRRALLAAEWTHPYPRERAAYPLPYLRQHKYWPPVGRLDNVLGDRQFVCACPPARAATQ